MRTHNRSSYCVVPVVLRVTDSSHHNTHSFVMPTNKAPLITSAGKDHIILSKQLCIVITVVIVCGGFLFYRAEQTRVRQSTLNSLHVKEQNDLLKEKNSQLQEVKKQLEGDEQELTKMYEKWLSDDGEDLALTKTQIKELSDKLDSVQASQASHEAALAQKEFALTAKEDILSDLHSQLRQKNALIKQMKRKILAANGTLPVMVDEMPDDDDWAW
eukprot:m.96079 g.96079  ORF g.96079 m.96079 type:complete len:215 (-) comp15176_c1_seq3:223-867(-)